VEELVRHCRASRGCSVRNPPERNRPERRGEAELLGTKKWSEINKLSKATDEDRAAVCAELEEEIRSYSLAELRRHLLITQQDLAAALNVIQRAASKLERADDLSLSRLRNAVEALGRTRSRRSHRRRALSTRTTWPVNKRRFRAAVRIVSTADIRTNGSNNYMSLDTHDRVFTAGQMREPSKSNRSVLVEMQ
jgi:transcriptional regulator with XRE-family HTH domain